MICVNISIKENVKYSFYTNLTPYMGNRTSKAKAKTPWEILGVDPTSTKEEVRSRFIHLVKKGVRQEIVTAYEEIKRGAPPLEYYSEDLLRRDLEKYGRDVYQKIGEYTGVVTRWGSPEFYRVFLNFQSPVKGDFNLRVRQLTRMIKRLTTTRIDVQHVVDSEHVVDSVHVVNNEHVVNIVVEKEFKCEGCCKGFRSTNQLLNHYRSRKHKDKYTQEEIERHIQSLSQCVVEEVQIPSTSTPPTQCEEETSTQHSTQLSSNHLLSSRDPPIFRTCSQCKVVFPTRREMVTHIKERHPRGG